MDYITQEQSKVLLRPEGYMIHGKGWIIPILHLMICDQLKYHGNVISVVFSTTIHLWTMTSCDIMCTQHVQTSHCLSCVSKVDIPGASYILNLDFEMRRLPWFNHLKRNGRSV